MTQVSDGPSKVKTEILIMGVEGECFAVKTQSFGKSFLAQRASVTSFHNSKRNWLKPKKKLMEFVRLPRSAPQVSKLIWITSIPFAAAIYFTPMWAVEWAMDPMWNLTMAPLKSI